MAALSYPGSPVGLSGAASGAAPAIGAGLVMLQQPVDSPAQDWRFLADTSGTITANNRVMVKAGPDAPETPMPGARVRLHRLIDGYSVWQGISDAAGYYHASGLEVGMTYIPVAIDLSGTYECVASGPVVAVKSDA